MNTTKVEGHGEGVEPVCGEWVIAKERFLMTDLGKAFVEFYREVIIERWEEDPGAVEEWENSFDFVRIRIYPVEDRICFGLLTATGRLQDEHCEDIYDFDGVLASVREALRERPPAPPPIF
jgi:hypothetical protein